MDPSLTLFLVKVGGPAAEMDLTTALRRFEIVVSCSSVETCLNDQYKTRKTNLNMHHTGHNCVYEYKPLMAAVVLLVLVSWAMQKHLFKLHIYEYLQPSLLC